MAESPPSSLAPVPQTLTETPSENGAGPPAPSVQRVDPVQVSTGVARSLRVYDRFPRMPEQLRAQQRTEVVDVDICVSKTGTVHDVRLRGASPLLGKVLREALLTWRYHPLIQQGEPAPFCHSQRLTYRP